MNNKNMETKQCTKCGEVKPLSEFYKKKNHEEARRCRCKDCCNEYTKKYWKKYYEINKEKIREYKLKNKKRFKEYAKKYSKIYFKQRRKEDISFRISGNLRARVNSAIKNNQKSGHTLKLLGCSIEELKKHIESLFQEGMTWDNYGTYWEIDHKDPCASFDLSKESEQKKCFHWTNLQPLTIIKNRIKGAK